MNRIGHALDDQDGTIPYNSNGYNLYTTRRCSKYTTLAEVANIQPQMVLLMYYTRTNVEAIKPRQVQPSPVEAAQIHRVNTQPNRCQAQPHQATPPHQKGQYTTQKKSHNINIKINKSFLRQNTVEEPK